MSSQSIIAHVFDSRNAVGVEEWDRPGEPDDVQIDDPTIRAVVDGGFTQIPNQVSNNPALSLGAIWTYGQLLQYARAKAIAWPAQRTMANTRGCTERTIRRWLTELRGENLVSWHTVQPQGRLPHNLYTLHLLVWR